MRIRGPVLRWLLAVGLLALLVAAPALAWASPASASPAPAGANVTVQDAADAQAAARRVVAAREGETVQGTLRNEGQPVGGVRISVEKAAGGAVGEARSGPDGRWSVPVPGPGTYKVVLDTATLPEGVSLREEGKNTFEAQVRTGQKRPVQFFLGVSSRTTTGASARALQLAAEGLRFGLIIGLAAVGLSLIFGTTGLTNFAHGELVTFGALVAFFVNVKLGLQLIPAAVVTMVVCGLAGGLLELGFWRRLRNRGTGLIAMMIVSIGLSILARYLFLYFFGGSTRPYKDYATQSGVGLGPISLTPKDLVSMLVAAVVITIALLALLRTRIGKATRAVADNPALAAASGIDVERVISVVWIAGAALAGLSGVLLGVNQQVNWQMGFQVLLLVFAAVTLGGLGTAVGALVGSLVVGMFVQVSTLVIPPELKNVGALAVLIVILLVRPQGILGRRERIG